jgi:hypothetical protein
MTKIAWKRCPMCGAQSAPSAARCLRCDASFEVAQASAPILPGPSYTEETVTIYHDHSAGRMIILSRAGFEYSAPDVCIRSTWANISSVTRHDTEYFMHLVEAGTPIRDGGQFGMALQFDTMMYSVRVVGLRGFGYPQNAQLCADLIRLAPQLTPDVRLAARAAQR